jgi:hypothetical protein
MRCYILSILVVLPLLFTLSVNAQHSRTLAKRIMVKTNLLNIIFRKPTLSIEKALTETTRPKDLLCKASTTTFYLLTTTTLADFY